MTYYFILDLSFQVELKSYLPTLYINSISEKRYIEKIANENVLNSIGLTNSNLNNELIRIIELCKLLQPEKLNERFVKKVKKGHFLEDKPLAEFFFKYIDERLDELIKLIINLNITLVLNLHQEKDFSNKKVTITQKEYQVNLFFKKNEDGLDYELSILNENKVLLPFHEKIDLLTNTTRWFVINQELAILKDVNTNKLKPFLTKQKLEIPNRILENYFNSFIKDIVQKVEVKAEGFDVKQHNTLTKCCLQAELDVFKNQYYFFLEFYYNDIKFSSESAKFQNVNIDFKNGSIQVEVTKRNHVEESEIVEKLIGYEFISIDNKKWILKKENKHLLLYLNEIEKELTNKGILINPFLYKNKGINFDSFQIHTAITEKNDWFDLQIEVEIGALKIPFAQFVPHLKNDNIYFNLPDGKVFIIPEEWFSKYNSILNHIQVDTNEQITLPKSKIALLENIDYTLETKPDIPISTQIKATLRPYQIKGVQWLLHLFQNGFGGCLADDMGLGKTLQILSYLSTVKERNLIENNELSEITDLFSNTDNSQFKLKALIVAPKSLLFNWYQESKRFTPHFHCITYIGNDRKYNLKRLKNYDLILTTYGTFNKDFKDLNSTNFNFIIVDESQNIKNKDSVAYKNLESVSALQKIILSGTPIENSIADLWSQMQLINKEVLGNYAFFKKEYLIPIEKNNNQNQLQELKNIIQPFILRRTKEEVLLELPEKTEQIIYCDLDVEQGKEYDKEKSKARNSLLTISDKKPDQIQILRSLLRLRQWSNHPKLIGTSSQLESGKFKQITNYILQLVNHNKKVLIFSSFVKHIEIYENWCKQNQIAFQTLTGKTKTETRAQLVTNFQNKKESLLFFISLKAGETGLNLTQASYVLFLDPWWNPYKENQALSRAHRMGQTEKVNVIRFITKNTIEEKIILLQEKKKNLGNSIFDVNTNQEYIDHFEELIS